MTRLLLAAVFVPVIGALRLSAWARRRRQRSRWIVVDTVRVVVLPPRGGAS